MDVPIDGSEDDAIHCFKEEQPCSTGLAVLKSQLDILDEPKTNPFDTEEYASSDVEEACPIIQQLVSDHEGDSDIEIDWKSETYWSSHYMKDSGQFNFHI